MADEIKATASLDYAMGNIDGIKLEWRSKKFDGTTAGYVANVQSIGTSAVSLDLGDVATVGMFIMRNLDATNYITIKDPTGTGVLKLKPLEFAMGRFATATPQAVANTAACELEYLILED